MLSLVSTSTVHIEIEAQVGDDEICGRIRSDAGPPSSFTGWLGLISAARSAALRGRGAEGTGDAAERRGCPWHER